MWHAFAPVDPRFIWMILRLQAVPTMLASQVSCEQAHVEQYKGNSTHMRSLSKFNLPNHRFGISLKNHNQINH